MLVSSADYAVFCATATSLDNILTSLSRLDQSVQNLIGGTERV